MKKTVNHFTLFLLILFVAACSKKEDKRDPVVYSGTGDISIPLNEFRAQLGPLNTQPGFTSGRREINWEGVPDSLMGLRLPGDFFNPVAAGAPAGRQRGLVYAGTETPVVSNTNFADINNEAAPAFSAFSGTKTFAVTDAALWPVFFQVAGQTTAASVKGFGAVFSDVDKSNSTFLEFYSGEQTLGRFYVPANTASGAFSFLGVYFPDHSITHVFIGHEGKLSDGEKDISQGGPKDLVILDDFIYSEPLAR